MSGNSLDVMKLSYKEEFEMDDYADAYGIEYTEKMGQLRDMLYNGAKDKKIFNVFGIEAGLGKSKVIVDLINSNLMGWENNDNYLIVKKFHLDIDHTVKALEENNEFKLNVLGITSDNWSEWRGKTNQLSSIRILVITHKRYLDLCLDDSLREDLTLGRNVLIIDEKIQFPSYSFSKKDYDKLRSYLPINLQRKFDLVCKGFLNILLKEEVLGKVNQIVVRNIKINNIKRDAFIQDLEGIKFKTFERFELTEFVNLIENIESTSCIHSNGKISCINPNYKLWGLDNNIILDASAGIDGIYKFGDFNVIGTERIIDHTNSTFRFYRINTSKSSMKINFEEISEPLINQIIMNHSNDEKTLIVSHKEYCETILKKLNDAKITDIGVGDNYNNQEFALDWFGNIIGANRYSEFDNCWIIGTPNIPYDEYVLMYMFYSGKRLDEINTQTYKGRFIDDQLRCIQEGYIASEIYQSIKRIQRNINPKGKYYVVNHNKKIIDMVFSQIKECQYSEVVLDVPLKTKNVKSIDNVQKFINLVSTLPSGRYTKKEICEKICMNIANFARLSKNNRVKALIDKKEVGGLERIILERTKIVIL